jgi:hypothetical protein
MGTGTQLDPSWNGARTRSENISSIIWKVVGSRFAIAIAGLGRARTVGERTVSWINPNGQGNGKNGERETSDRGNGKWGVWGRTHPEPK